MSATSPRKSAPRKTPARKPPARPVTDQQKVDAFEEYRARAKKLAIEDVTRTPFTLGREWGFDPPIEIAYPATAGERFGIDIAWRSGDFRGFLFNLLDRDQLLRVLAAVNDEPDADALLHVLMLNIRDHFLGEDIADAPGGTRPS